MIMELNGHDTRIFRAGYQQAISDLCKMFDETHVKYQRAWSAAEPSDEVEVELEYRLIALNDAICRLTCNSKTLHVI